MCPPPCPHCSPCGKKFRSKPQIARFLGEMADLTPFDFSRAGTPGDGTQRRRARDRTNTTKRLEPARMMPLVRPLSSNPLRATGPIRRTCGVIKLPVTWVAPPSDEELRSNLVAANPKAVASPISLVVQALWEKRLFGVKPCDHTGSEIPASKTTNGLLETPEVIKTTPLTPISKSQSTRVPSPPRPLLSPTLHSPPPIMPSSLLKPLAGPRPAPLPPTALPLPSGPAPQPLAHPHLQQNLVLLSLQQQQQGLGRTTLASNGPTPGPLTLPQTVSLTVTDNELKQQEERVRLLRQQLLAAQSSA